MSSFSFGIANKLKLSAIDIYLRMEVKDTKETMLSPPNMKPRVRRLSSRSATLDDLSLGPSVVVPPQHMEQPTDAHETAAALELAKHRISKITADEPISTPTTPPVTSTTDAYAFAFDIDGVLIRGGEAIPEAIEAMKILNGQNQYGVKMSVTPGLIP